VGAVCAGTVGAIFCLEASRLARNGREWHHPIELWGLTGTVIVDPDGIYDQVLLWFRRENIEPASFHRPQRQTQQ
jgi:hypothetical protein